MPHARVLNLLLYGLKETKRINQEVVTEPKSVHHA